MAAFAEAAAVDATGTFALLKEGEQLSAGEAADLEGKVSRKPGDLEDRLRLLSFYARRQDGPDMQAIRTARGSHILWLIRHEPKAAIFSVATRVYALQPAGGPLADAAQFETAKEAWQSQISSHPKDIEIKRNAATFFEITKPELAAQLLKQTGDNRWLGQVYAKAILGIVASDYASSDPILANEDRRNSPFSLQARKQLEDSNDAAMLGGAGFTLCRDGGILYADGKLDWDYTPLARSLLARAEQIDPSNKDAFSVVPVLPQRGERPPVTVRVGASQSAKNLIKRTDPVYPRDATWAPVHLNVLIGLDGSVLRAVPVSGPDQLRRPAADAVKQWVYAPTSINGKPVYVLTAADL